MTCKFGEDEITRQELETLEKMLDKLFASLDIDVEFTKHFHDRVNDARNKRQITLRELTKIFQSLYQKYGFRLTQEPDEIEEVIKSISTDINIPVVLEWNFRTKKIELIAKTVMRKKNFKSRNKVLKVESFKTFLREKWIKSGKYDWGGKFGSGEIKVYTNPTPKELNTLWKAFRGFIAENGTVYVGSDGIHPDIAKIIKDETNMRNALPFVVDDRKTSPTVIYVGDYVYNTKYSSMPMEQIAEIIKNNRWMKKTFKKISVLGVDK